MTADVAKLRMEADSSQVRTSTKDLNALSGAAKKTGTQVTAIASRFKKLALTATALGGAMGLANGAIIKSSAQAAQELTNLSRVAGVGVVDFQKYAFASRTVGVEQDKLADILKDVNDKIGDFMQTGAGPMADFFEQIAPQVGVTADQFRNLNSRDALQLYVSSLERANVSQADMTFYMEAIASDATLLLPLLQGNGKAMSDLANQSDRFGLALSEIDISRLTQASAQLQQTGQIVRTMGMIFAAEMSPYIQAVTESLSESFLNATGDMQTGLRDAATTSALVFADIVDHAATVVGFIENNPDTVQYGILGYMILGKKGALLGAAIGTVFDDIDSKLVAMGAKSAGASDPIVEQLAIIDEKIKQASEKIDFWRFWKLQDSSREISRLIEQVSILQFQAGELRAQIVDGSSAQSEYSQFLADSASSGNLLSTAMSDAAQAIRDAAAAQGELSGTSGTPFTPPSVSGIGGIGDVIGDSVMLEQTMRGLISTLGSEMDRAAVDYMNSIDQISQLQQSGMLETVAAEDFRLMAFEAYQRRMTEIEEAETEKRMALVEQEAALRDQAAQATFNAVSNFADAMTQVVTSAYGEQSDAANIAFAVQQGFQFASAIMSAEVAAASVLAAYAQIAAMSGPAAPAVLAKGAFTANAIRAMGLVSAAAIMGTNMNARASQRAMGGQVQSGDSVLVGERGPEVLTMGASGYVTPNHGINSGGGVSVTNVFQISTGVAETVQAEFMELAPVMVEMSKQAVIQAISSGGSMTRAVGRRS